MADLTYEILTNREKFPDDAEITLAGGEKVTVKDFRDAVLPKGDMTRVTEKAAQRERELTQQAEGLQRQLQEALAAQRAAGEAPKPTAPTGTYSEEDLLNDPVLGPIVKKLKASEAALNAHQERLALHENYVKTREYQGRLNALGQRYQTRFKDKKFSQADFLDYVQKNPVFSLQNGIQDVDLETAYDKFVREDEIAEIRREAEQAGIEKGKQQAKVPPIPFGRRRAPVKDKSLEGKDFQSVTEEEIANDPEIQAAMYADAE